MSTRGKAVIIGSGVAGLVAARTLASSGWDVTVIERGRAGGTCLWYGCMPKKALYNAARAYRSVQNSETFGLSGPPVFDWQSVLAWKWHAQVTYAGDQKAGYAERGIRFVAGEARFTGPDEITVAHSANDSDTPETESIAFDHAIVATGSVPIVPAIKGIDLADNSTDALSYPAPPDSLLVVGGGFIGIELATIYATFGSRVTLATAAARPLEMLDEDVSSVALDRLARMGVAFHTSSKLIELGGAPGAIDATIALSDGSELIGTWNRVLLAVGRRPALDGLELAAAGVTVSGFGTPVLDEALCSTNPRVWFAGDVTGGMMQTPAAGYQGRTVARSIDSGTPTAVDTSAIPTCLFTTPQIAQIGLTEAEARARGIAVSVTSVEFDYSAAAVIEDERDGRIKLVFAEEDGRLLGAHIAGPSASDLIYAMALALRCGATRDTLRQTIGIHPAYCEVLHRASF